MACFLTSAPEQKTQPNRLDSFRWSNRILAARSRGQYSNRGYFVTRASVWKLVNRYTTVPQRDKLLVQRTTHSGMPALWDMCFSTPWGQSTFLTCTLIPHPDVTRHKPSSQFLCMEKAGMKRSNGHVINDQKMRPLRHQQCSINIAPKQ